jgi:two-component system, response regulator
MTSRPILLVEDNPDDVALTLRALKKNHILNPITVASDGAEALECLFGGDDAYLREPGLILLDLKLPKVDGLEVLRRIKADKRTEVIPVVVLTSSKLEEDILTSYRNGANSYVRKPVNFAEFAEAIKTLGMYWLLLNEAVPE